VEKCFFIDIYSTTIIVYCAYCNRSKLIEVIIIIFRGFVLIDFSTEMYNATDNGSIVWIIIIAISCSTYCIMYIFIALLLNCFQPLLMPYLIFFSYIPVTNTLLTGIFCLKHNCFCFFVLNKFFAQVKSRICRIGQLGRVWNTHVSIVPTSNSISET